MEPDLTIVGAGVAGLTAAIEAAERGWRVTVAEAHSRPGGRARSLAAPFRANHGPHAIYVDGPWWTWLERRGLTPPIVRAPRTRRHPGPGRGPARSVARRAQRGHRRAARRGAGRGVVPVLAAPARRRQDGGGHRRRGLRLHLRPRPRAALGRVRPPAPAPGAGRRRPVRGRRLVHPGRPAGRASGRPRRAASHRGARARPARGPDDRGHQPRRSAPADRRQVAHMAQRPAGNGRPGPAGRGPARTGSGSWTSIDRIYAARYSLADPALAPPGHELIQITAACAPGERKDRRRAPGAAPARPDLARLARRGAVARQRHPHGLHRGRRPARRPPGGTARRSAAAPPSPWPPTSPPRPGCWPRSGSPPRSSPSGSSATPPGQPGRVTAMGPFPLGRRPDQRAHHRPLSVMSDKATTGTPGTKGAERP